MKVNQPTRYLDNKVYAKVFKSMFDGSLRGRSDAILVFVNLMVNADREGYVDRHFTAIRDETGLSLDRVKSAIKELEAPDPESKTPDMGGRRLERLNEHRDWGWRVVNYMHYRQLATELERREQNRRAQETYRKKHGGVSLSVEPAAQQEQTDSSDISREMALKWVAWARTQESEPGKKCDYTDKEALEAWTYYVGNGWLIGRNPVADYRAALEKRINDKRGWSKDNEKHIAVSGKGSQESGRSRGTYNEGTSKLYADCAERPGRTWKRQTPPVPVEGVQPVPDVQRPDAGTGAPEGPGVPE